MLNVFTIKNELVGQELIGIASPIW